MSRQYYIYILKSLSTENKYYIGQTEDLDLRLKKHNSAKVRSTKSFIPWLRIYTETFPSRSKAMSREKYLKSGYGRRWLKENLIIT